MQRCPIRSRQRGAGRLRVNYLSSRPAIRDHPHRTRGGAQREHLPLLPAYAPLQPPHDVGNIRCRAATTRGASRSGRMTHQIGSVNTTTMSPIQARARQGAISRAERRHRTPATSLRPGRLQPTLNHALRRAHCPAAYTAPHHSRRRPPDPARRPGAMKRCVVVSQEVEHAARATSRLRSIPASEVAASARGGRAIAACEGEGRAVLW